MHTYVGRQPNTVASTYILNATTCPASFSCMSCLTCVSKGTCLLSLRISVVLTYYCYTSLLLPPLIKQKIDSGGTEARKKKKTGCGAPANHVQQPTPTITSTTQAQQLNQGSPSISISVLTLPHSLYYRAPFYPELDSLRAGFTKLLKCELPLTG